MHSPRLPSCLSKYSNRLPKPIQKNGHNHCLWYQRSSGTQPPPISNSPATFKNHFITIDRSRKISTSLQAYNSLWQNIKTILHFISSPSLKWDLFEQWYWNKNCLFRFSINPLRLILVTIFPFSLNKRIPWMLTTFIAPIQSYRISEIKHLIHQLSSHDLVTS